jgi:hypothetical protein
MMGLGWLLLTLAGGVQATEFQLDTDTPDSLCPELSMTREAVRQRLGQLETEAGGRWHGVYSSVHDPTGRRGDYVRLIIRDAEGREQLQRELPLKGESCETLAQAIALVVDSHFREIALSTGRDDVSEKPRPASVTPPESTPEAAKVTVVPSHTSAPKDRVLTQSVTPQRRAALAVGANYESVPSQFAASVGLTLELPDHWRWQFHVGFPLANEREAVSPGVAKAYVVPMRFSLGYVVRPARRLEWVIGPELFFSLEHGATDEATAGRSGWRVSPGIGAQTVAIGWVTQSVGVYARLAADEVVLQSRKFLMYEQPVFEFSRMRLSGGVGLWAVIWP